jgi:hypothetical protein
MYIPPGGGPPPHRHDFEETFIILEGQIAATFRGANSVVRAGETINIPANAPHQFHNSSANPVRMLCICSPAGQENFFKEVGVPVATRTTTPPTLDVLILTADILWCLPRDGRLDANQEFGAQEESLVDQKEPSTPLRMVHCTCLIWAAGYAVPSDFLNRAWRLNREELTGVPGTRVLHIWFERKSQRISTLDLFDGDFVPLTGNGAAFVARGN